MKNQVLQVWYVGCTALAWGCFRVIWWQKLPALSFFMPVSHQQHWGYVVWQRQCILFNIPKGWSGMKKLRSPRGVGQHCFQRSLQILYQNASKYLYIPIIPILCSVLLKKASIIMIILLMVIPSMVSYNQHTVPIQNILSYSRLSV